MGTQEFEIIFDTQPEQFEIEMKDVIKEVYPELEDLEITPSAAQQNFKSEKYGFDNVIVKAIEGATLDVAPSKEKQSFKGLYDEVIVNEVTSNIDEDIRPENIKSGINILGVDGSYEGVDTSDATATAEDILHSKTAYINNEKVIGTMQEYDGSYTGNTSSGIALNITNAKHLFYYGSRLENLEEFLTLCKKIEICESMFTNCDGVKTLDLSNFNTSNVTTMKQMFSGCNDLVNIILTNFNTSKVTNMISMFANCSSMVDLDLSSFDMSNVVYTSLMFSNDTNLTNLRSFKNLGKGYTQKTNNYSNHKLDLSSCTKLTYESLIDVITNGLYDLNLTYDVANGGTLYRQSLVLGSTNLAKLTAEEIAIATNKGWDVS